MTHYILWHQKVNILDFFTFAGSSFLLALGIYLELLESFPFVYDMAGKMQAFLRSIMC